MFGELHPKVLRAMDVKGPAMGLVIWPGEVPEPARRAPGRAALALSDLQAVERDFAFVVDRVEALSVVNAAQGADKGLIESVTVFDEFVGGALGEGRKSLAITVRLQPTDKTLTEDEIEAVAAKIVEKVGKATGGVLRGLTPFPGPRPGRVAGRGARIRPGAGAGSPPEAPGQARRGDRRSSVSA